MAIGHGIRKPPPGLERLVRERVDDRLRIRWSDHRERWIIYRICHLTGRWIISRVMEDAQTNEPVRNLDGGLVDTLQLGDPWRRPGGVDDILNEIQDANDRKRRSLKERMKDAALEGAGDVCRANSSLKTFDMAEAE